MVVGVLGALTLAVPEARAGRINEPIHGDLNGDGRFPEIVYQRTATHALPDTFG